MQAQPYDTLFYRYQRTGAERSASALLPQLLRALGTRSVLDVGCGAGAWTRAWHELGVETAMGVDGDYVDRSTLLIDPADFIARDVTQPFDFGRRFDLVQCLEVGEHVPRISGPALVENLVWHGSRVLFSAAPPGQGGADHINERPYEYWRDLFLQHGFRLFDFVRPAIGGELAIEPWYRFNILFFAHDSVIDALPEAIRACRVPDTAPIADLSPPSFRLRKAVLRHVPAPWVSTLAGLKHRWMVSRAK